MDPDDTRLEELFSAALELDPSERPSYLDAACGGDSALRTAVEELLRADASGAESVSRAYDAALRRLGGDGAPGAESEPSLPERIGPYRVESLIGEGGMAVVYRAEQETPRRPVAVKVIRSEIASERMLRRFEHEAEILGRLQHPGIARIIEAGTEEGERGPQPFLVMELVEGPPLQDYVRRAGVGVREKVRLILKVCEAVRYAHQRGVIHRDLKPANIVVDGDGEPRVLDFGVARLVDSEDRTSRVQTETHQIVGTTAYMSPEQLSGDRHGVDTRSDVYSLGVVAFEVLTGKPPHDLEGRPIHEAARVVCEEPAPSLGSLAPELRGDLETIVAKALEKDRERRYASVSELAGDLQRFLEDRPVLARPPSALYQLSKYARRNRGLVAGLTGILIAVLIGGVLSGLFAVREARQRRVAERQRDEILRLADARRLSDYLQEMEDFRYWPQSPEKVSAMEAWRLKAEALVGNLPTHRESLRMLSSLASPRPEERWQQSILSELVEDLRRFAESPSGGLQRVRRRLAIARACRGAWADAVRSIASEDECPLYRGLRLEPLDGLIPLRRAPESGLWEFLRPLTELPVETVVEGGLEDPLRHGLVLVLVPGGSFTMGSPCDDPRVDGDERPEHEVELDPFLISKYEVTQEQWESVMEANPSRSRGARLPVDFVTWEQCMELCRRTGLELPTEAEWERACRAGSTALYAFGDGIGSDDANFNGTKPYPPEAAPGVFRGRTVEVDTLRPNAFGLHHVHGNLWEWCEDVYDPGFYAKPESRRPNPVRFGGEGDRVLRGGGYRTSGPFLRSATRHWMDPRLTSGSTGFRPVLRVYPPIKEKLGLADLRSRAERLFDPASSPGSKPLDLETWLSHAARIETMVEALRSRELATGAPVPQEGIASPRRSRIRAFLADWEEFQDPRAGLRVRVELLHEITRDRDRLWAEAIRSIGDPSECPAYGGLKLSPQLGMVPWRREPESGLWCFVHVWGLEIPRRTAEGRLDTTDLRLRNTTTLRFMLLPGGSFAMGGADPEEGSRFERPRHAVELDPFFLARFEVTLTQWRDVMRSHPPGSHVGGHPVESVSWYESRAFCDLTGLTLPTEAQWEYGCRAGTSTAFFTGDALTTDEAVFDGPELPGTPARVDPHVGTQPIDALRPNAFGLYHMHGNVAEHCLDVWRDTFYSEPGASRRNPALLEATIGEPSIRVFRGGGWNAPAERCRSAARSWSFPGNRMPGVGFRPAYPVVEP